MGWKLSTIYRQIVFMAKSAFLKSIRNLIADSGMLMKESYSIFDRMAHLLRELAVGLKSNNMIEGKETNQLKKAFDFLNANHIANEKRNKNLRMSGQQQRWLQLS